MRIEQIIVQPFPLQNIISFTMSKSVNHHAIAQIKGVCSESTATSYIHSALRETNVTISGTTDENTTIVLFSGILENCIVHSENGVDVLEMIIVSGSMLMDLIPRTRTFQDAQMMYSQLLDFVTNYYPQYGVVVVDENDNLLPELIVQYKETDWEFIKRMASHFNTVITPDHEKGGAKYYFGVPTRNSNDPVQAIEYEIKKDLSELISRQENGLDFLVENDAIYYIVTERNYRKLGDKVKFLGVELCVHSINSIWSNEELIHRYSLKTTNGFKVPKYYNERIIGASLDGNIVNVISDVVQAQLSVDSVFGPYAWLPYSTVYSSPDGSGWYAMPEIGDEIRLYFPTEIENESYVISSVHMEVRQGAQGGSGVGGGLRVEKDEKSIRNKFGKEILLTPSSISFTNNGKVGTNNLTLTLVDGEGIFISSDHAIKIESADIIEMMSTESSISMTGAVSVSIKQGDSAEMLLKENVLLKGAQVRIED